MWIVNIFNFIVRIAVKHVIPFFIWFGFWLYNVHTMIYLPGEPAEAYYRFYAAVFFPVGVVWGMFDAVVNLVGIFLP
ncbi:hypothetical protein ZPAH1_orf00129 [Aeromonas phage ZPAH1]|nr:hypothetical protein ASwh1_80 [Aeromonas phage Aswh_1]QQG33891.1 hypothetical protein ZPAH1_orf00129 [Aeromonas phage ZPAH1]